MLSDNNYSTKENFIIENFLNSESFKDTESQIREILDKVILDYKNFCEKTGLDIKDIDIKDIFQYTIVDKIQYGIENHIMSNF